MKKFLGTVGKSKPKECSILLTRQGLGLRDSEFKVWFTIYRFRLHARAWKCVIVHSKIRNLLIVVRDGEIIFHTTHSSPIVRENFSPEVGFIIRSFFSVPASFFAEQIRHETFKHARREIIDRWHGRVIGLYRSFLLPVVLSLCFEMEIMGQF